MPRETSPASTRLRLPADDFANAVLGPVEVTLFENLYLAYHDDARRLADRLLGDRARAEDAVHTAYLEMLRYLLSGRRWHDPGDARAVVLRNARWAALKILRTQASHRETQTAAASQMAAADDWARLEVRALCTQIVGRLRPRDRAALRLHYVEAVSHADAAARMGISEAAFKSQLARALRSARRVARELGATPAFGLSWLGSGRGREARRGPRHVLAKPLRRLVATAAAGAICAPLATWVVQAAQPSPAASAAAARVEHAQPSLDSIYASVVADMIRPVTAAGNGTVLALGRGLRCGCWILWRSDDDGRTWAAGPGPAALRPEPRLAIAESFPADPRIFVVDGASGRAVVAAASFGQPFAAAPARLPRFAQTMAPADIAAKIAAAAGGFTQAAPGGGRCSDDDGRTWQACSP